MIQPRISFHPECSASLGREAIELAASAGVFLDDWQQFVLERSLGVRADGKWASFENASDVGRQNGKNEIALVRELSGLFLFGERLLIHSAHEFKTSTEHQRRLEEVIQNTPDLHKRVKPKGYKHSHGEESIELRTGQRIRFMTRTKGGGRGHTGDTVVFDEAMILAAAMLGALMPTMSARSILGNPQLWYFFTAVDQTLNEHGMVASRLRSRAIAGTDPSLSYFEWSAHVGDPAKDLPDVLTPRQLADRKLWAQANPAIGIRISEEHIEKEHRSMDARTFAVERLGIGDWPNPEGAESIIDLDIWDRLMDQTSELLDPVCFAFDVSPARDYASISAAGSRPDGFTHLDLVDRRRGTGWVIPRIKELVDRWAPLLVVTDDIGPGSTLCAELEEAGIQVRRVKTREHQEAVGMFVDGVDQSKVRHLGRDELRAAIKGATKRTVTDRWLWDRKNSVDITPLVSVTLAYWAALQDGPSVYEDRGILSFSL